MAATAVPPLRRLSDTGLVHASPSHRPPRTPAGSLRPFATGKEGQRAAAGCTVAGVLIGLAPLSVGCCPCGDGAQAGRTVGARPLREMLGETCVDHIQCACVLALVSVEADAKRLAHLW